MFRAVAILVLISGGAAVFVGWQEKRQAAELPPLSQKLTCQQLGALEPRDNRQVILSDYRACRQGHVFYQSSPGQSWKRVFIPVCPRSAEADPIGEQLRVVVMLRDVDGESDMHRRLAASRLTGIARPAHFYTEAVRELPELYPGFAPEHCWILATGERLASATTATNCMIAGGLAVVLGGILLTLSLIGGAIRQRSSKLSQLRDLTRFQRSDLVSSRPGPRREPRMNPINRETNERSKVGVASGGGSEV